MQNIDYSKMKTSSDKAAEKARREADDRKKQDAIQMVNARLSALGIDASDLREWMSG